MPCCVCSPPSPPPPSPPPPRCAQRPGCSVVQRAALIVADGCAVLDLAAAEPLVDARCPPRTAHIVVSVCRRPPAPPPPPSPSPPDPPSPRWMHGSLIYNSRPVPCSSVLRFGTQSVANTSRLPHRPCTHSYLPPPCCKCSPPSPPPPSPPAPPSPLATRCMRRGGPADRARGCLAWMNRHECMWHGPMPYSVDVVGLLPQADPPLLTHTHAHLHALSCCLCSPPSPPPPTPPSPPDPRCVQHAALHCGLPGAMERPRDVCTDDIHAPESLLVASPG